MNGVLAPGLSHPAHSVLNAIPHVPVGLFVMIGAFLIVAVLAGVAVVNRWPVAPYLRQRPGTGEDAQAGVPAAERLGSPR